MRSARNKDAFSLSELLVVVAVILILTALLLVGVQSIYSRSVRLQCQHRLEQIGLALRMYANSHRGMYPRSWDPYTGRLWYETLAKTHLDDWEIIACPAVGESPLHGQNESTWEDIPREHVNLLLGALRWLKDKQETTGAGKGRWTYKTDGSTTQYYQGVTGLGLLSFIGFGCTDKNPPELAECVRMAVEYLSSDVAMYKTGADAGRFKNNASKSMYAQGICTMALAGASRVVEDPELKAKAREAAQLALNYLVVKQPSHGSYGYYGEPTPTGFSDTSVCGWVYQGMAAAHVAGLNVPQVAFDRAEEYLNAVHDSSGRSTYWWTWPNGGGGWLAERHTGIALTGRLLLGHGPDASDSKLQANWLMSGDRIINYQQGRGGKDLYGLYYVTLAMSRMGGSYWEKWAPVYPVEVLKQMIQDSAEMVHWPGLACGSSAQYGGGTGVGDTYATCMAALTVEAAFEEHWLQPDWSPAGGKCSYGYNNRLGVTAISPSGDTITVMDYGHWQIDHDDIDVDNNDTIFDIAARHGGQANCLFADGRVKAYYPEDITPVMWTPETDQ